MTSSSRLRSEIWLHFSDIDEDNKVTCLYCDRKLSVANKSTCCLIRHLDKVHPAQYAMRQIKSNPVQPRVCNAQLGIILNYMKEHSQYLATNGSKKKLRMQFWEELTLKLNDCGYGTKRSKLKWIKVWSDWKAKTKKKMLELQVNKLSEIKFTALELDLLKYMSGNSIEIENFNDIKENMVHDNSGDDVQLFYVQVDPLKSSTEEQETIAENNQLHHSEDSMSSVKSSPKEQPSTRKRKLSQEIEIPRLSPGECTPSPEKESPPRQKMPPTREHSYDLNSLVHQKSQCNQNKSNSKKTIKIETERELPLQIDAKEDSIRVLEKFIDFQTKTLEAKTANENRLITVVESLTVSVNRMTTALTAWLEKN